jgi:hypothetical protein
MPKVRANLADVSTEFVPALPGDYEFVIDEIEDKTQGEREAYNIKSSIDMPGTEEHGKPVWEYISMTKKDGSPNGAGSAQLKRYFEACFGKDEVADPSFEYDTDLLLKQRFGGSIVIEEYEKDGKSGQSNKFKKIWQL